MAIHREACYQGALCADALEHTERATDQTLLLPMHAELTHPDLEHVVNELRAIVGQAWKGTPGVRA